MVPDRHEEASDVDLVSMPLLSRSRAPVTPVSSPTSAACARKDFIIQGDASPLLHNLKPTNLRLYGQSTTQRVRSKSQVGESLPSHASLPPPRQPTSFTVKNAGWRGRAERPCLGALLRRGVEWLRRRSKLVRADWILLSIPMTWNGHGKIEH